eukprot:CAMPEP_0203674010 /NCGR_PEP_ID=MMETSP0090-20130426/14602_1 /ASSEMBLY_ACC=CAM_ASM_001088 /TAXON_ID=426623 /ORGANISM="Chaetoceros affinis, Strain CCMP159" /LENGTH=354 /DNA_ID=CAMNT_0050539779 /DNA_START=62 /DNA_END=1123 /DNA_ORIENTATION=+
MDYTYQTMERVQDVSFEQHPKSPSQRRDGSNASMKKSGSRSTLSRLTRATSFMTWDTWDTSSRTRQQTRQQERYADDEEAQMFPALLKRVSLQSFTGLTILPTIYGSTNEPCDEDVGDDVSEFSYMTGIEESFSSDELYGDSGLSYEDSTGISDSTDNDLHCGIKNVFMLDGPENYHQRSTTRRYEIEESDTDEGTLIQVIIDNAIAASVMVKEKSKGIKSYQSAPHFSLSECVWTFSGSFTIIFLLCFISANITLWNENGGYAFPLGPFGALTTLHYSLGDCPPAQPRNVILGSALSGTIAILTTYLPETIVCSTLRIAFATSFSIAAMAALGIMHPPGGAIALVFALGGHHW